MNFLDAVTALSEGRCEGIRRPTTPDVTKMNVGILTVNGYEYRPSVNSVLATDWVLVNEKPQYEEVEVVRWECLLCGAIQTNKHTKPANPCCVNSERVELKGTYQKPIKQKAKHREEITAHHITSSVLALGVESILKTPSSMLNGRRGNVTKISNN